MTHYKQLENITQKYVKMGNVCISRLATCRPPVIVRYCRIPYLTEFPKLCKAMTQSLRLHSATKGCGLHGAIQAPVPIRARRNLMVHFSSKNEKKQLKQVEQTSSLATLLRQSREPKPNRLGNVLSGEPILRKKPDIEM